MWKAITDSFPKAFRSHGDLSPLENENESENELISGEKCNIRRVFQTKCRTEEVEPGKFVNKCERIEKLFKECDGRPPENVETRVEYTEDVPSNNAVYESHILPKLEPFIPPILHDEIDNFQHNVFGGLESFLQQLESMRENLFGIFSDHQPREKHSPYSVFNDDQVADKSKSAQKDVLADYAKDFKEI
eukprot:TRINITY_DN4372_c0_g1_i1.p1 TRINITY_DN4372_c0_g1~~TRINITY_DN4372_c0_g1_i1.p1  ORF type:complete len:189 (+),score=38.09 TRINITY_DN4372_c0_g1_i1:130-696(+)